MSLLFSTGAIAGSAAKGAPGMVLLTPTSIAHSGTSASIGANGQVTFTAVTSLSLNGVFSADFDNYVVSIRSVLSSSDEGILAKLRLSGTDTTGSDYTYQYVIASGGSVNAGRAGSLAFAVVGMSSATQRSGDSIMIYGPALTQPTAFRQVSSWGFNSASIQDNATTHSLSTAYDGITLYPSPAAGRTMTGALQVYGVRS